MIIKSNRKGHNKKFFIRMNLAYKIILALIVMAVMVAMVATHLLLPKSHFSISLIPKIIWQTAKSHNPPPASKKIIETWDKKNPDWKQTLLDDEELVAFISTYFNQTVVNAFKDLPLPVMKADFFRLAVMYYEGGVYADVDVECKKPIRTWSTYSDGAIDRCDVVIGMENDLHLCNWGFASRRHHPLFKKAVDLSLSRFVNTVVDISQAHFVHAVTGPAMFTQALTLLISDDDVDCEPNSSPKDKKLATPHNAKALYECRNTLRKKYGICLFDQKTLGRWFQNHYSSQQEKLQSEDWMTSWTQQADKLLENFNKTA
mmetsp:Transcript_11834/g.13753  ORF Transcript_11834/g.13753 Transcript_11834/m.13753 type:complete len:316 (+) Transcript_11834:118-1065(+)